jgi:DnaJ-class molecular chaperone
VAELVDIDPDQALDALDLQPGASVEEIRRAYRDLVNVWHPDRFVHDPRLQKKAEEKLKIINEAYGYLLARPAPPAGHTSHKAPSP